MNTTFPKGVATGRQVQEIFQFAKAKKFALPAVNVIGNNSINTVLETAAELNSPVIIQFSNGGAQFNARCAFPVFNSVRNSSSSAEKPSAIKFPFEVATGASSFSVFAIVSLSLLQGGSSAPR